MVLSYSRSTKPNSPKLQIMKSTRRAQWQMVERSLSLRKSLPRSRSGFWRCETFIAKNKRWTSGFLAPDRDRPPQFSPSKLQRFTALFSPTTDESFCFEPFSIAVAFNTLLFRYLPQWLVIALPIPWYFDSYETNFFRYLPRWTQAVGPQDQWRRRRTQQGWALADFPATFFHMIYI